MNVAVIGEQAVKFKTSKFSKTPHQVVGREVILVVAVVSVEFVVFIVFSGVLIAIAVFVLVVLVIVLDKVSVLVIVAGCHMLAAYIQC